MTSYLPRFTTGCGWHWDDFGTLDFFTLRAKYPEISVKETVARMDDWNRPSDWKVIIRKVEYENKNEFDDEGYVFVDKTDGPQFVIMRYARFKESVQ